MVYVGTISIFLFIITDCSPTVLFGGREISKLLDLRIKNTLLERIFSKIFYVFAVPDAMNKYSSETKLNLTNIYNNYHDHYHSKDKT